MKLSRRRFVQSGVIAAASSVVNAQGRTGAPTHGVLKDWPLRLEDRSLDLSPARWIWYPSRRILPNTIILFRRHMSNEQTVNAIRGWLIGESRYRLYVNGRFIQSGPAPADPRWTEADPVDIDLQGARDIVIAVQVLYYGHGEGTWPTGKPGFLCNLELEHSNGHRSTLISNREWQTHLAKSWPPGHYKRWYLRAFQEEFDARLYPHGWQKSDYKPDADWLPAMEITGSADKPALAAKVPDHLTDAGGNQELMQLRRRSIPLLNEFGQIKAKFVEAHHLQWQRPVREYFDIVTPEAYHVAPGPIVTESAGKISAHLQPDKGLVLTFEYPEQIVGWPYFTIQAPAGTTIELMVQEAHEPYRSTPQAPALMNNKFHSWSRFICRQGENRFEPFDFESFRWVQLHIHNAQGDIVIKNVGARRRLYPWRQTPQVRVDSIKMQKVIDAAVNTVNNSAQDILVDGMARERQQYSGDVGHMLHATLLCFGAQEQAARYLNTFSQGLTKDGYFMDCWPAYDRLNRIAQRQLDLTKWGPLIDHGVGFNFDCWHYYRYTGDLSALTEVYPRLVRFFGYLLSLVDKDGLLPTEGLGVPAVWIEHGISKANIKCSFNLYVAAMLQHAFPALSKACGETQLARQAQALSKKLLARTTDVYWSPKHKLFISNRPTMNRDGEIRLHDRSLATAILFDQCPNGQISESVRVLAEQPRHLHLSYPANSGWRLWALGKAGRTDKIIDELETRWYDMPSVCQNNSLGEWFTLKPDTTNQWCHAPVAPLYVAYMNLAGIKPLSPGFSRVEIRPQPARLQKLALNCWTPKGQIHFDCRGGKGHRELQLALPQNVTGELVLARGENVPLKKTASGGKFERFEIPGGKNLRLQLKHT